MPYFTAKSNSQSEIRTRASPYQYDGFKIGKSAKRTSQDGICKGSGARQAEEFGRGHFGKLLDRVVTCELDGRLGDPTCTQSRDGQLFLCDLLQTNMNTGARSPECVDDDWMAGRRCKGPLDYLERSCKKRVNTRTRAWTKRRQSI
jgi:hypothetical protein